MSVRPPVATLLPAVPWKGLNPIYLYILRFLVKNLLTLLLNSYNLFLHLRVNLHCLWPSGNQHCRALCGTIATRDLAKCVINNI